MANAHPPTARQPHHPALLASLCLALFCSLASTSALASGEVTREHLLDASNVEHLEVQAAVGAVRIRQGQSDQIRVRLDIQGSRGGILRRRADVRDLDLTVNRKDARLQLAFLEEQAAADWIIELPRAMDLTVQLGVGELLAELAGGELDVKVGVGDVDLRLPKTAVGPVLATAGVGDARIVGTDHAETTRTLMSERASGQGSGSARAEAKVGVGSIEVRLH